MTSIKINVPIHEEDGWTTPSSPDNTAAVKARLEARTPKTPKTPEALKRTEERAAQLHRLHVEATQARAAKENARAKEVVASRLRRAASSRQNLLSRFEEQATHREEKQRLAKQHQTERQALRKNTATAAHAARAAAQAEKEHRLAVIRSREEECARQAEKARQQRVQRVAYHLKQALAKATAIKEGRKESLEAKQERMLARLGAAEERREELAKEMPGQGSARLADKAAHAQRAAQREATLRAERAQLAMAAAAARREEAINARVRLQARLAPTKASKEAEKDRAEAVDAVLRRRALFERLNAADHRRGLLLWRRVRGSRLASMRKATQAMAATVIVVDVVKQPAVADHDEKPVGPTSLDDVKAAAAATAAAARPLGAALLARLLARPERSAAVLKSRELAAASRHALALAAIRAKAARSTESAAAAARKRAALLEATRAAHEAKLSAAAARVKNAAAAQLAARAERAAARRRAAAAACAAARDKALARSDKAGARHLGAAARRGTRLEQARGGVARRGAARAFVARRFARGLTTAQRGAAERARCDAVASRRAALLAARVAQAVRMATPRGVPTKLSIDMALDAAAGQAFKASPLLKQGGAMHEAWPRLAAVVVAAAAERVRRKGIYKRRTTAVTTALPAMEKTLEDWTLVDEQEQGELAA